MDMKEKFESLNQRWGQAITDCGAIVLEEIGKLIGMLFAAVLVSPFLAIALLCIVYTATVIGIGPTIVVMLFLVFMLCQ